MRRKPRFTLWHGLAASLVLHSALGAPFVLYAMASPPEDDPTLVIELQGSVADMQSEQKLLQETKGEDAHQDTDLPKPPTMAPTAEQTADSEQTANAADDQAPAQAVPPKDEPNAQARETATNEGAANNVQGMQQQQSAQTIKTDPDEERARLNQYVKVLAKKIQGNLIYPDKGRRSGLHGVATVSFGIRSDGQIRPETLKIVQSSGQSELDASALETIRACAPFTSPPEEVTVAIAVAFGRK